MNRVYLDAATSAPLAPAARGAMVAALEVTGDPLAIHEAGRAAREVLDRARGDIAHAIGAEADEIVFTSGGTGSVALSITGMALGRRGDGNRLVTSAVEHPAVLSAVERLNASGFEVVRIGVDADGRVDLDRFATEIRRPGTTLASIQHANHETGTLQQIGEAARLARAEGVPFHTDAAQTVGHLPIDVDALSVGSLSLSARKFGGPPGVGALYVRRGIDVVATLRGDDREGRRRAGAPNVAAIAGMAAALRSADDGLADEAARAWTLTAALRDELAEAVDGLTVHGHPTHRVPHIVCFSVEGLDPATLAMALDDRGFDVGAGSIVNGRPDVASPVLTAMGVSPRPSFRIGVGRGTSPEQLTSFVETLRRTVADLRRVHGSAAATMSRFRPPEDERG